MSFPSSLRVLAGVASALVLLAGCTGGSSEPSGPATPTLSPGVVEPSNPPPTGTPAPEALSDFRCEPDGSGTYTATGAVSNGTKAAATFQVTVTVGLPSGTPQAAVTQQVPKVGAGDSATFEITGIPVTAEGGTCHVQVVTTK